MLRVRDGLKSVEHYRNVYGFTLVDQEEHEGATSYFLGHFSEEERSGMPPVGSAAAHAALATTRAVLLELRHIHGTESDESFAGYNNGNVEPHRGFGHIAVHTDDVYAACEALEREHGIKFQKKPDEGRMKGLAFALDPDGYWVEIVKRTEGHAIPGRFNLSQTMIRVKDAQKELAFFRDQLGMTCVRELHFEEAKFSLYFLASLPDRIEHDEDVPDCNELYNPILELTHNHGTEKEEDFSYHNGNTEPKGFGNLGFITADPEKSAELLVAAGAQRVEGSGEAGVVLVSPSGYWVRLLAGNPN